MLVKASTITVQIAANGYVVTASAPSGEVKDTVRICSTVDEVLHTVRGLLASGAVKSLTEDFDGHNSGPDSPEDIG